jgi:hypothetical protein
MTQRDQDRRAALGWIAGQLAWETRLQTLRTDEPTDGVDGVDGVDAVGADVDLRTAQPKEIEPAA